MSTKMKMPAELAQLDTYLSLKGTAETWARTTRLMQLGAPFAVVPDEAERYTLCFPSGCGLQPGLQPMKDVPAELLELDKYFTMFGAGQVWASAIRLMQLLAPFAVVPDAPDEYLLCFATERDVESEIQKVRSRERWKGER